MHTLAVELAPDQFLARWRAEPRLLFVAALSEARPGDPAAVRITIANRSITATVFGKVSSVRRMGRPSLPPGAELAVDPASLPALRFLSAAARGEEVSFHEREPRWIVQRSAVVLRRAERLEVTLLNVSSQGCAIEWDGPPPAVGDSLRLKLDRGLLAPAAEAVVCWGTLGRRGSAVGLRLVSGGLAARTWRAIAAQAERSGARSV